MPLESTALRVCQGWQREMKRVMRVLGIEKLRSPSYSSARLLPENTTATFVSLTVPYSGKKGTTWLSLRKEKGAEGTGKNVFLAFHCLQNILCKE